MPDTYRCPACHQYDGATAADHALHLVYTRLQNLGPAGAHRGAYIDRADVLNVVQDLLATHNSERINVLTAAAVDNPFTVGDDIHGYAGGAFGRDSYQCRFVIAVGNGPVPWIVTQQFDSRQPEFTTSVKTAWDTRDATDHCTCYETRDRG